MAEMMTTTVLEDSDGQLLLDLGDIINQVGWTEETLLEWEISGESVILKEKE